MKWILSLLLLFPITLYAEICALCGQAPLTCPPVSWLIATGLDPVLGIDLSGNYYVGFQGQGAGTMSLWTLRIGPIVAPNPTTAYQIATTTLSVTQFLSGPIHITSNAWVCNYVTLNGILVQTITPPIGCFNATAP
jgi:hypothetical protein